MTDVLTATLREEARVFLPSALEIKIQQFLGGYDELRDALAEGEDTRMPLAGDESADGVPAIPVCTEGIEKAQRTRTLGQGGSRTKVH